MIDFNISKIAGRSQKNITVLSDLVLPLYVVCATTTIGLAK